jgi:hypothetical protein
MDTENRPHFRLLTVDLYDLVDRSWNDAMKLVEISRELLYRDRRAAMELLDRVTTRMAELLSQRDQFLWPSTETQDGNYALDAEVFKHDTSPLSAMGYRVGMKGPADEDRQSILERAYMGTIPPVNNADYMTRWARPQTAQRLQRMAELLAANIRNQKKRGAAASQLAILEWERDLAYLKTSFYDGRYDRTSVFIWPDTTLC